MHIGIVGAGHLGSALACRWIRAGHSISLSFCRNAHLLNAFALALGPRAEVVRPDEAAAKADVVLLSVPFSALDDAVEAMGEVNHVKPLITTISLFLPDPPRNDVNLGIQASACSAAETIQARLPSYQVVEAFTMILADLLARSPSNFVSVPATVPLCGNHTEAKAIISGLIEDAGLFPVDVGDLKMARSLEALAATWVKLVVASNFMPLSGLSVLNDNMAHLPPEAD